MPDGYGELHAPTTVHADVLSGRLWHAGKKLLESTLMRLGLFCLPFGLTDLTGGLLAALVQSTIGEFLLVTTVGSYTLVGVAALASPAWFRKELRRAGIHLRLRRAPQAA